MKLLGQPSLPSRPPLELIQETPPLSSQQGVRLPTSNFVLDSFESPLFATFNTKQRIVRPSLTEPIYDNYYILI